MNSESVISLLIVARKTKQGASWPARFTLCVLFANFNFFTFHFSHITFIRRRKQTGYRKIVIFYKSFDHARNRYSISHLSLFKSLFINPSFLKVCIVVYGQTKEIRASCCGVQRRIKQLLPGINLR